jgi:hypothetical protein
VRRALWRLLLGYEEKRPAEDPVGFVVRMLITAVTHLRAKIFMPIRTMKCVTNRSEESCPGIPEAHIRFRQWLRSPL